MTRFQKVVDELEFIRYFRNNGCGFWWDVDQVRYQDGGVDNGVVRSVAEVLWANVVMYYKFAAYLLLGAYADWMED